MLPGHYIDFISKYNDCTIWNIVFVTLIVLTWYWIDISSLFDQLFDTQSELIVLFCLFEMSRINSKTVLLELYRISITNCILLKVQYLQSILIVIRLTFDFILRTFYHYSNAFFYLNSAIFWNNLFVIQFLNSDQIVFNIFYYFWGNGLLPVATILNQLNFRWN